MSEPELTRESLFDRWLPDAWAPLVAAVSELGVLAAEQAAAGDDGMAERRGRAAPLRERIVALAADRVQGSPDVLAWGSPTSRRWFTEAVLLWTHFANASGRVRVDMLGAAELGRFPIDLPAEAAAVERVRAGVKSAMGWTEEELAAIERELDHRLSGLALKRAISGEIARRLQTGGAEAAVALMRAVYGDLPLRAGDVAPVVTTTGIFFCLPLAGDTLDVPGYAARPAAERQAIADFAARVSKAATSLKNVRFPAFGLFDPAQVAPDFHRELAAAVAAADPSLARVPERAVADTFATMVLVIPSGEAAKYLIHDSWGHGWQESLCEFEWLFGSFQDVSAPLAGEALRGGFVAEGGRAAVDAAGLEQACAADLRRRIAIGLNLVVAEALADLMEHKYARQREPLPSSSLLPEAILKLDLSWIDASRVARLWAAPYRRLVDSADARRELCDQLAALGLPREGLPEAVEAALHLVADRFAAALPALAPAPPPPPGRTQVDLVQRAVLGVATLEAALALLIERGEARLAARAASASAEPRWRCPAACIDLLAVLVGWFYDQDPDMLIWHLDELVARELWPALLALEAGIDAAAA